MVIGGGSQFSTYDLTVNGVTYFNATIEFPLGGAINLGTGKGYIRSINVGSGMLVMIIVFLVLLDYIGFMLEEVHFLNI